MKSALFLDVVIGKSSSIFELLSRKNETLLVRRDSEKAIRITTITT
jgi:hypothetical protein